MADGRIGGGAHRRFELLVVCTANLCRSPMLEAQFRQGLARLPGSWSIVSAGTEAVDGHPMHPYTAQVLIEREVPFAADWRSRRLRSEHVERADLVLTATRVHRSAVVVAHPGAAARVFTVRQFARLLAADPVLLAPDRPGSRLAVGRHPGDVLAAAALTARGSSSPSRPEDDDLGDPIGRPYRVYRELAADVAAVVDGVTAPFLALR